MSRCAAFGCETQTSGRLCGFHAGRLKRGFGLPTCDDPRVGDPSGHGRWGVVDRTGSGVLCHECGHRFANLGIHLVRTHELSPRLYRDRHGIHDRDSLTISPTAGQPLRRAHPCRRCGTELIVPGKLCADCRVARRDEVEARKAALSQPRTRRARWRALTDEERDQLLRIPSAEARPLIESLQRSRVTSAEIAAVLGRNPKWMTRNHPRPDWNAKNSG